MNPENDGVTHINVYSDGRTKVGRDLSNFTFAPFCHPLHGVFNSVEGYWYWLTRCDDRLRATYGLEAKKIGRSLPKVKEYQDEVFRAFVKAALTAKLEQNQDILKAMLKTELPFVHYYVMGPERRVIVPENNEWIMNHFSQIRAQANPNKAFPVLDVERAAPSSSTPESESSQLSFF